MKTLGEEFTFCLSEYEERLVEGLSQDVAQRVQKTGLVEVSRRVSGEFVLKAGSKVGFVSSQGVQVNVAPRFPIYNIFYFLGLLDELKFEREDVHVDKNTDFLTVLFQSFIQSVNSATRKGLISGYVNMEDSLQVIRGRVDFSRQLKRNSGSSFPFEVSYDDFVEDIPENQVLKKALRSSLKYGLKDRRLRNQAQNILFRFRDVSEVAFAPSWGKSRLNFHYWKALRLAELILSGSGFHEDRGDIQINGFNIDMFRVFEDFIARQLALRVNTRTDTIAIQKTLSLDMKGIYREKPDLIWYRDGKPYQVLDTKYKEPEGSYEQRDSLNDLRQVISYASLLGLKQAHIIYGVAGSPRSVLTRHESITIFTHGIDLGLTPIEIQKQLDEIVFDLNRKV